MKNLNFKQTWLCVLKKTYRIIGNLNASLSRDVCRIEWRCNSIVLHQVFITTWISEDSWLKRTQSFVMSVLFCIITGCSVRNGMLWQVEVICIDLTMDLRRLCGGILQELCTPCGACRVLAASVLLITFLVTDILHLRISCNYGYLALTDMLIGCLIRGVVVFVYRISWGRLKTTFNLCHFHPS